MVKERACFPSGWRRVGSSVGLPTGAQLLDQHRLRLHFGQQKRGEYPQFGRVFRRRGLLGLRLLHSGTDANRPIERGRPGPGLLAHVLVNKYADHPSAGASWPARSVG